MVASTAKGVVESHREHLFPWVKPYYADPPVLESAEGVRVRDKEGREYLDLFSGILTTSVGHANPDVLDRVEEQMRRLGHTSTLYVTENQVEVAETLAELSPGALKRSAFTNSGTEAIETAITAACLHTGRSEIVVLRYAYSGRSILATNVTGHAPWRPMPSSIPGICHARAPYVYRSPLGEDASEAEHTDFFVDDLVEVIDYKTDVDDSIEQEYRKQLSVYYHVIQNLYGDKKSVSLHLFYSSQPRFVRIDPLSQDQLVKQLRSII
jgi:4-aminobutyrate aminotransferase-like enzyme